MSRTTNSRKQARSLSLVEPLESRTLMSVTPGTPDISFSGDGVATVDFYKRTDSGDAVVAQPDGKIIVAGSSYQTDGTAVNQLFTLARFNTDGSLDTLFGIGGRT